MHLHRKPAGGLEVELHPAFMNGMLGKCALQFLY